MSTKTYRENFEAAVLAGANTDEFDRKRRELGDFLCKMATGMVISEMDEIDDSVSENYLLDAEDSLLAMPHLLGFEQREALNLF